MTDIDTNVANYTLSELLTIVGIENENVTHDEIIENTNALINKFKVKKPQLAVFFKDVQSQLLQYADGLDVPSDDDTEGKIVVEGFGNMSNEAVYPAGDKQVTDWFQNENLTQSDQNQVNKITQRKQIKENENKKQLQEKLIIQEVKNKSQALIHWPCLKDVTHNFFSVGDRRSGSRSEKNLDRDPNSDRDLNYPIGSWIAIRIVNFFFKTIDMCVFINMCIFYTFGLFFKTIDLYIYLYIYIL